MRCAFNNTFNTQHAMARIISIPLLMAAVAALSSCTSLGTIIVDYDIDVEAKVNAQSVQIKHIRPQDMKRSPPPAGSLLPFGSSTYQGATFDWTFSVGTLGLGGSISNKTDSELCIRFDQSTIASNFSTMRKPLLVSGFRHTASGEWTTIGHDRKKRTLFTPPKLCVPPLKKAQFSLSPDLETLFPSGKMFNVEWRDRVAELIEKGISNKVMYSVTVESPTRAIELDVTMVATDSRARWSYY